jgi:hypothetical protein
MSKKMMNSDRVLFTFACTCDECQTELDDASVEEQIHTISDLQSTGWPLCKECDKEIWSDALCTVKVDLEKDLTVADIQKIYKLQNLKMSRDYLAAQKAKFNV